MTVDEAIETLLYEIDEECHCQYISDEIHLLIETVENQRLQLQKLKKNIERNDYMNEYSKFEKLY